ncbi:monovalent cation/H+ antiporter subunit D family protein [Clostridium sediminicola]|uniref:complex I subunit 5 family protein n=1 Tax=Clostridium sediminicola TaxID=3114879 RepID=UPI0031F1DB48
MMKSLPLVSILILFLASFPMPLFKKKGTVKAISVFSMASAFIVSLVALIYVQKNGAYIYSVGHFEGPIGIEFFVGNIETLLSTVFTFVALMITWFSVYSIDGDIKEKRIPLYFLLVNILIASILGLLYTNDLFNAFVFIEIGTITSCGIIIVKDKKENIKATLKYLIMSTLGSGLVLMGIAFIFSITGQLNISYIHEAIAPIYSDYENAILIALGLFTIGIGVKSAMFPLHSWLPDAHSSAPTSSSAILSSLVLKGYVYLLIKILYRAFGLQIVNAFPILRIILILGSLGMIMGSVFAIFQKELKRVIAYSSVAQMGYIFFGIGLGTELGFTIAIFHMIGHAVTKSALFLISGTMIHKTGSKKVEDLKGIGKEMPLTLTLFLFGALSMVGIPVLPGFVSKWYLSLATIEAGDLILIAVILLSSLLNAVYYFPIVINGFFGEDNLKDKVYKSKMVEIREMMPVIILIISMILVGLVSKNLIDLISVGLL